MANWETPAISVLTQSPSLDMLGGTQSELNPALFSSKVFDVDARKKGYDAEISLQPGQNVWNNYFSIGSDVSQSGWLSLSVDVLSAIDLWVTQQLEISFLCSVCFLSTSYVIWRDVVSKTYTSHDEQHRTYECFFKITSPVVSMGPFPSGLVLNGCYWPVLVASCSHGRSDVHKVQIA